jgi:hypothetical protein
LAKVIQLESKRKPAADSPLTPAFKEFIDSAIVPILVKQFLAEQENRNKKIVELARGGSGMAKSVSSTAALPGQVRP